MLSHLRNRAGKRLREPFGKAGLTVAVIALVFAMLGGAYAASGLNSKQKKEVKAIAKSFQGTGPAGPAGTQGPGGASGTSGTQGEKGEKGEKGDTGANGKNVAVSGSAPSCFAGGATVQVAGEPGTAQQICNGEDGAQGPAGPAGPVGSPWALGGTLPAGATETGAWTFTGHKAQKIKTEVEVSPGTFEAKEVQLGDSEIRVPISFTLPLAGSLSSAHVHFGKANGGGAFTANTGECPSSAASIVAKAKPGELCVYEHPTVNQGLSGATFVNIYPFATNLLAGASQDGAIMKFTPTAENAWGAGSFAVTAPNPIVSSVSPNHGPAAGGTSVTITGENLEGTVKFDTTSGSGCVFNSEKTSVTCNSPAHAAGTVDVTVTASNYISPITAADHYTYE